MRGRAYISVDSKDVSRNSSVVELFRSDGILSLEMTPLGVITHFLSDGTDTSGYTGELDAPEDLKVEFSRLVADYLNSRRALVDALVQVGFFDESMTKGESNE